MKSDAAEFPSVRINEQSATLEFDLFAGWYFYKYISLFLTTFDDIIELTNFYKSVVYLSCDNIPGNFVVILFLIYSLYLILSWNP